MKINRIDSFSDKQIINTNLFFNGNQIFVDNEDYKAESNPLGCHPGIFRHNITSGKIDKCKFLSGTNIISVKSVQSTLYYAVIQWGIEKSSIHIRKLDCIDFCDTEAITIIIENKLEEPSNPYLWNLELFGISERYVIAAIPCFGHTYGSPGFSKILLIDSREQKSYKIPDKLGTSDSLLRLSDIWVSEDRNHANILLKTGRISANEKDEIWSSQKGKNQFEEYYDQLETLLVISSEHLVRLVKSGENIPDSSIIDYCNASNAFHQVGIEGHIVKYHKREFDGRDTQVVIRDIVTNKEYRTIINGTWEKTFQYGHDIFAIKTHGNYSEIIDPIKKESIFKMPTHQEAIFLDDNKVITCMQQEDLVYTLYCYSRGNNKVTVIGEGWFVLDEVNNILTIFTKK